MFADMGKEIEEKLQEILCVGRAGTFQKFLVLLDVGWDAVFFIVGKDAPKAGGAVAADLDAVAKAGLEVL